MGVRGGGGAYVLYCVLLILCICSQLFIFTGVHFYADASNVTNTLNSLLDTIYRLGDVTAFTCICILLLASIVLWTQFFSTHPKHSTSIMYSLHALSYDIYTYTSNKGYVVIYAHI